MYIPRFLHFLSLSAKAAEPLVQVDTHIARWSTTVPQVASIRELGTTYDNDFPNVFRDNGGGGNLNGINFIVFSDTAVTDGGAGGALTWFVSNSIAAINYNDPADPLNLFDFGSNGRPNEFIPRQANESDGNIYAIWPNSNITPLSSPGTGLAAYPVLRRDAAVGGGVTLYNTLVKITLTGYGPVATRLVPQLFYAGELQYGSFGMTKGIDGYVYMFAAVSSGSGDGIKVCRVAEGNVADRTQYTYWNGASWASTPPEADDATANMLSFTGAYGYGPVSGDIYYNSYYNCWIAIFFDAFVDGIFRLMYTTDTSLVGSWTDFAQDLYTTTPETGYYNYAGHAYPGVDSGKTLLLSWTYGTNLTKMANLTFS